MEEERVFTGYCRHLDQSRMVTVETENGRLTECDCRYGNCLYESGCTLARQISAALTGETQE